MQSIMQYPDKGFDVEIWLNETDISTYYIADIKYPCGELVKGQSHISSKRNAVLWAVQEIEKMNHASHKNCRDEYCANNKYLSNFKMYSQE